MIPQAFRDNLPELRRLIERYELHQGDGPVSLRVALREMEIAVRYFESEARELHGMAARPKKPNL